jgi:hypothetical protein
VKTYLVAADPTSHQSLSKRIYVLDGHLVQSSMSSMHILQLPSFLGTMMMGDPQGEVLGFMTPYSNNCCNCFLLH